MSLDALDPVLQPPKRLAALGVLDATKRVDFSFLRDHLGLSDSDLSKQLKALSDAGYVTSKKTGRGSTRRSWFSITPQGSTALATHAAALRAIIEASSLPAVSDGAAGSYPTITAGGAEDGAIQAAFGL